MFKAVFMAAGQSTNSTITKPTRAARASRDGTRIDFLLVQFLSKS
jgi:hypothetical protein